MLYEKSALKTLRRIGARRSDLGRIAVASPHLLSPQQLYTSLLPMLNDAKAQRQAALVVKSCLRSDFYDGLYNTNELYICYADMYAQKSPVYLVEIDIKDCTNLIRYVSSRDVYVIKSFLFKTFCDLLKERLDTNSVFGFDYTKNDDCMIVVPFDGDKKMLQDILIDLANTVTESALTAFPTLNYQSDCLLNFGISQLGQGRTLAALFHDFEEKTNIKRRVKKCNIPPFRDYFRYKYTDRGHLIKSISDKKLRKYITNLYFKNEDAAGGDCCGESRFFDLEDGHRFVMNIKFNNFSGLNKLLGNKYYSYLLLGQITRHLGRLLNIHRCRLYFVGQNTFWITTDKVMDFQRIIDKIDHILESKINPRCIYDFFDTPLDIPKNLRLGDLKSRKGYKNGISISNINTVDIAQIHDPRDLLNFKIQSYMQQFDQKDN